MTSIKLRARVRVLHALAVRSGCTSAEDSLRFQIERGYIVPNPNASGSHDRYMITDAGKQITDIMLEGRDLDV